MLRKLSALTPLIVLGCGPSGDAVPSAGPGGGEFLFAWVTDSDSVDLNFLAVLDATSESDSYGDVLRTLVVPTSGRTRGHHTEHSMPEGGFLFANDFGTGEDLCARRARPVGSSRGRLIRSGGSTHVGS